MSEELLQFIWKYQLYRPEILKTTEGEQVEVIHVGHFNTDSGPDFFNAKIKIGDTLWAGNVELHIKSSDWYVHKHEINRAYNNVILHVVLENDSQVTNQKGQSIPTLQVSVHEKLLSHYKELMEHQNWLPCKDGIHEMHIIEMTNWLEKLVIKKFEDKTNWIFELLKQFNNDWNQVFFVVFSRAMGFSINGDAFEKLARSIPVKLLFQSLDKLNQIEALLMGQAGLLNITCNDDYYLKLRKEFEFLKKKCRLNNEVVPICRFMRTRPSNFPTIRLSQFASFINQQPGILMERITSVKDIRKFIDSFELRASEYWNNHYIFGEITSDDGIKKLGSSSKKLLLINVIAPLLFAYGKYKGEMQLQEQSIDLLENLPPENNTIIKKWEKLSEFKIKSAFDSQAVIYLKNNFCNLKKCLSCSIGHHVLNNYIN